MSRIVRIPAGSSFQNSTHSLIRPLFENTGVPNYFSITPDIPPQVFDMEMPERDYTLAFRDERASRAELRSGVVHIPSLQQVLFAVGFMSVEMEAVIRDKPVRFVHPPFRVHKCPWKGSKPWRQILVSYRGGCYFVGTVCVADDFDGSFFAYVL